MMMFSARKRNKSIKSQRGVVANQGHETKECYIFSFANSSNCELLPNPAMRLYIILGTNYQYEYSTACPDQMNLSEPSRITESART